MSIQEEVAWTLASRFRLLFRTFPLSYYIIIITFLFPFVKNFSNFYFRNFSTIGKRLRRINSRFDVLCLAPLISAAWVFWDENQICTGNYATCPAIWTQLWESNPLSRGYEPHMIFRFTQLQYDVRVVD